MYNISLLAKQYAPWSISKAGVAETCAAQFNHKYILKTVAQSVPSANTVGTHAHSILEYRIEGKSRDEAAKLAAEKTPLTTTEQDDLRVLEDSIESFLVKWDLFCKKSRVQEIFLEAEWAFTADYKKTSFFAPDVYFRGKVDLAALTADRDLIVLDHKSGDSQDITGRFGLKFKKQLWSYAVMAAVNIENLAGVRCGINFLQGERFDKLQWLDYIDAPRIRKLYTPGLYDMINGAAKKLVAPFEASPKLKWPCEWCSYRPSCNDYLSMVEASRRDAES